MTDCLSSIVLRLQSWTLLRSVDRSQWTTVAAFCGTVTIQTTTSLSPCRSYTHSSRHRLLQAVPVLVAFRAFSYVDLCAFLGRTSDLIPSQME